MMKWYREWRETDEAKWIGFAIVLAVPMLMAMMP